MSDAAVAPAGQGSRSRAMHQAVCIDGPYPWLRWRIAIAPNPTCATAPPSAGSRSARWLAAPTPQSRCEPHEVTVTRYAAAARDVSDVEQVRGVNEALSDRRGRRADAVV